MSRVNAVLASAKMLIVVSAENPRSIRAKAGDNPRCASGLRQSEKPAIDDIPKPNAPVERSRNHQGTSRGELRIKDRGRVRQGE